MRGRRLRRGLLVGAALVLLLYLGVSWLFSERLIAPDPRPLGAVDVADYGLPRPEVTTVPGDGVELASWYFDNPRRERCAVVMLHGFGGQRAEVVAPAPIFWRRGCDLLLYDASSTTRAGTARARRRCSASARTSGAICGSPSTGWRSEQSSR